ncbi:unnamed protein product [Ectocarpus sp. 8 AP-2014]
MASKTTPTNEEIDAVYRSPQAASGLNAQSQPFIPGQRWCPSTSKHGASQSRGESGQAHHFHVETIQTGRGTIRRYTTPSLTSENDANSAAKMPAQSSTPMGGNDEEDSRATEPVTAAEVNIASDGSVVGGPDEADVAGLIEETKDEEGETAVASSTESSSSSSPTGGDGRRKWKGLHVGVWLAIGAGVAVGAALWSRRR